MVGGKGRGLSMRLFERGRAVVGWEWELSVTEKRNVCRIPTGCDCLGCRECVAFPGALILQAEP
jgi:hypothetical protein